ncbi:MAG: hypothetical protein CFE40_05215 [Burkholderiales bacterium PBB1]|nr:MAG: hypothetical protein CFE40_05215 [Burkholderiales bacterium PBB1]
MRRCAWAGLALVVLWVLAWAIVPPVLKSQAQQRLSAALGRTVTLGDVSFSPWSLELTLRNIVIGGAPDDPKAPPLLKVARLYVNADISSLLRVAPVVEAFEIDAPELRLARTAPGHYDIDDLIARFQPASPEPAPSEPLNFALYNLKISDASVLFDDRPVQQQHRLEALHLGLPFLANLPSKIDVKVEPRLAFRFNGTPFDTGAQATPFAQTRQATLQLKMGELDLLPYIGYLPPSLPVRLRGGSVAADLVLDFAMPVDAPPRAALRGSVGVNQLAVDDAAGAPLLAWKRLAVALRDVRPLSRELSFGVIELDAPTVHLSRDAAGRLNLAALAGPPSATVTAPAAASSAKAPAAAAQPWKVQVEALQLHDLGVLWADASTTPHAALALQGVEVKAGPLAYPFAADAAMPISLQAALAGPTAGGPAQGSLAVEGRVSDRQAQLELKLSALALEALAPYVSTALQARVSGQLAASAQVNWAAGDTPRLAVSRGEVTLDDLQVADAAAAPTKGKAVPKPPAVALKQFAVQGAEVDVLAQRVTLASVKLAQPALAISRDGEGVWNVQRWSKAPVAAATPAQHAAPPVPPAPPAGKQASAPAAPGGAKTGWQIDLRDFTLDGGSLRVDDAYVAGLPDTEPVRIDVRAIQLGVQALTLNGARTTAPAKVHVSARLLGPRELDQTASQASNKSTAVALGAVTSGVLDWRGQLGLQPLMVKGALKLDRFPLQAFEPYVRDQLPVRLLRAETGVKANVAVKELPAGMDIGVTGDVLLADVLVHSRPAAGAKPGLGNTDELLSWQSFKLSGINVAMAPGRGPVIDITEAALADFYSRLVITEEGRFNLQDVSASRAAAPAAAASAPAAALTPTPAASPSAPGASAAVATTDAAAPALQLSIGATKLTNGRVDFSDHFVRPNYSAELTELNGSLGAFRSGSRDMATLELHGRAAGTALLDISGQLNPMAKPLALNIRAKATDLELAPLSPYAGKYAGYAIERGKLSMDVSYAITPDGRLEAKNQVILNQLTFGERIDSPSATKLPVLLAVALLKDRHGVIDINLPISGSLNDPQFSVAGIIFKVILNLIEKAITAPFSLMFGGGGEDLSEVAFGVGVPYFTESGAAALDKVAKALADRPSLKMTVTGVSDPVIERDGYVQAVLDARLAQERKKEAARAGAAAVAASAPAAAPTFAAGEREELLKAVYKDTDIPDKPRNLVGLAKSLPAAEMEALLKSTIEVTPDAMRQLALQRGLAVRDALVARGLPSERLFVAAPKVRSPAGDGVAWLPSAKLSLTSD